MAEKRCENAEAMDWLDPDMREWLDLAMGRTTISLATSGTVEIVPRAEVSLQQDNDNRTHEAPPYS